LTLFRNVNQSLRSQSIIFATVAVNSGATFTRTLGITLHPAYQRSYTDCYHESMDTTPASARSAVAFLWSGQVGLFELAYEPDKRRYFTKQRL
jgi:hypothetical protein